MNAPEGKIDGARGLKTLDRVEAELTNALVHILDRNEISFGEEKLTLRVVANQHMFVAQSPWFVSEGTGRFQILRADGALTTLSTERLVDAVATIDAVDPLLGHLESRIGVSLEPVDLVAQSEIGGVALSLMAEDNDAIVRHMLNLVIPVEMLNLEQLTVEARATAPALRDIPCLVDISVCAASLTIDDALGLAVGDLLLVGQSRTARLVWRDAVAEFNAVASLDFTTGTLTVSNNLGDDMEADMPRAAGGFAVPITISLPPCAMTLETLGNLKPGTTLPIGAISNGLAVNLTVGGRQLATGEIVQIGNQFAVLIKTRIDTNDGSVPPPADDHLSQSTSAQT